MSQTLELVTAAGAWRAALEAIGGYDFHHTYAFHAISEAEGEGAPLLVVGYEDGVAAFAWPLLAREIPEADRKDLSSAYGYPGPLATDPRATSAWIEAAFKVLAAAGFVSVFGRLHPVGNAALIADEDASYVRRLGDVVAADLSRPQSELKREIRGYKNGMIKKIEKTGVTVRESKAPADIPAFQTIYHATMDRLEAGAFYYFSDAYVAALLATEDFDARLVFAELDGVPIAASIMVETAVYQQYYLSGTDPEHFRLSPVSLVLAREVFAAKERGRSFFVLGGGFGGQDSGLARFKLGFSKTVFPAGLLRKVLDETAYAALSAGRTADDGFFPLYRAPEAG